MGDRRKKQRKMAVDCSFTRLQRCRVLASSFRCTLTDTEQQETNRINFLENKLFVELCDKEDDMQQSPSKVCICCD